VESFDLGVDATQPISGPVTVEPRLNTPTVVFNFSGPIYSAGFALVKDGQNTFYGASTFVSGNSVIATFTGVPNTKRVTVTLSNVNNANITASASIALLAGDLNASRSVTASDILIAKGKVGGPVLGGTFQYDVDADHNLTSLDVDAVKAKSGTEQQ